MNGHMKLPGCDDGTGVEHYGWVVVVVVVVVVGLAPLGSS